MRDPASLNSNDKDLIPCVQTRKYAAANRFLNRCILLGFAFRVRTDPYLVARRSSGMFREVIVVYVEANQGGGFHFLACLYDAGKGPDHSIYIFGLKRS